jgi:hypothetical protein
MQAVSLVQVGNLLINPWFLGGLFVALNAFDRFNRPAVPVRRSTTTFTRYYSAVAAYMLVAVLTYVSVGYFGAGAAVRSAVPQEIQKLTDNSAILYALCLTVFLPKFPGLSELDRKVRDRLHELAAIPAEARRLANELRQRQLRPDTRGDEKVEEELAAQSLGPDQIKLLDRGSIGQPWRTATALVLGLRNQESELYISRFFKKYDDSYAALGERYKKLAQDVKSVAAAWMAAPDGAAGEAPASKTLRDFEKTVAEQVNSFIGDCCTLISYAALHCSKTDFGREWVLRQIGFAPREIARREPVSWNQIVLLFLIFCGVLFTVVLGAGAATGGANAAHSGGTAAPLPTPLMIAMVALVQCVAVWCALYPKGRWKMAEWHAVDGIHYERDRPWPAYLTSGVVAAVIGLCISVVFHILARGRLTGAMDALHKWGWAVTTFATGAVTAYLADNSESRWPRWMESLLQAGVGVLAAGASVSILLDGGVIATERALYMVCTAILTTGTISALIGYCVPTWYRTRPRLGNLSAPPERELAPILAAHPANRPAKGATGQPGGASVLADALDGDVAGVAR